MNDLSDDSGIDIDAVARALDDLEDVQIPEGLTAPRRMDRNGAGDATPEPPQGDQMPPAEDPPERRCAKFPMNDYGNGQRFIEHFGEDLIFVGQVGWHVWDGMRWKVDVEISKDTSPRVRGLAQQMGERIARETRWMEPDDETAGLLRERFELRKSLAEAAADPETLGRQSLRLTVIEDRLKAWKKQISQRLTHAKNAGNSGPLSNMIREASVLRSKQIGELDASPLIVNTQSGALRFSVDASPEDGMSRTARVDLLPHDRDQLLTKVITAAYEPNAKAPTWTAFLARVQPDPIMRAFLQRWYGLSMTGLTSEQKLVFQYGAGANGKSVLVDVLARIMGDYAASAKIESLTGRSKRSGAEATPDLIPLIGARMVRASEPEEGERLQEGKIKELTGGEPILVRALNMDFVEVLPQFKLTISGNHKPEIRGTDDGIWRRVLLVPFDVQIPKAERDPLMAEKLYAERAGILNWLVDGLVWYLEDGLQEPATVLEATAEFRAESDPIGTFLELCCVVSGHATDRMSARDLGDAFGLWLADQGQGAWQPSTVAKRLAQKAGRWQSPTTRQSFQKHKASTMSYTGIRLNDVFGRSFRDAPRDSQGRIMHGRRVDAGSEGME